MFPFGGYPTYTSGYYAPPAGSASSLYGPPGLGGAMYPSMGGSGWGVDPFGLPSAFGPLPPHATVNATYAAAHPDVSVSGGSGYGGSGYGGSGYGGSGYGVPVVPAGAGAGAVAPAGAGAGSGAAPVGVMSATAVVVGDGIRGKVMMEQAHPCDPVTVHVIVNGLSPGLHGFHVHEFGDLSSGCKSAGGHFNPDGNVHGGPADSVRHAGDMGNILASAHGMVACTFTDSKFSLCGPRSVVGRSIVIHADADDLGRGNAPDSKTTGAAGGRVACGVIGIGNFELDTVLPSRDEEVAPFEAELAKDVAAASAHSQTATVRKARKLPVFIEDDDEDHRYGGDADEAEPASAPASASASASAPAADDSGIDVAVFDDDPSFGQRLPSLESITYIYGAEPAVFAGRVNLVYFWAKWDKAGYAAHAAMAALKAKYEDTIHITAISVDPKYEYATSFLNKDKYADAAEPLKTGMTVAWDTDKLVNSAMKELICKPVLNLPHVFLINKFGKVVWRDVYRPGNPSCLIEQQLSNLLAGAPLISVGNAPEELVDDYSESASIDGDGEDFALF